MALLNLKKAIKTSLSIFLQLKFGMEDLDEGQELEFEIVENNVKFAENLK